MLGTDNKMIAERIFAPELLQINKQFTVTKQ